jgi:succinate-acetate transporter protein
MAKKALLISIIVTSILSFNLWMILPFSIFYKGLAVVFVLTAAIIRIDSKRNTSYRSLCDLWLMLSLNNFFDEMFFNPQKISYNEYLFGLIIIIYTIVKVYGKNRR